MSKESMRALFIPIDAVGHVNSCTALAQQLMASGHEVVFAVKKGWKGSLQRLGIQEFILPDVEDQEQVKLPGDDDAAVFWAKRFHHLDIIGGNTRPIEKAKAMLKLWEDTLVTYHIALDRVIEDLLAKIKPDVILLDQNVAFSSVERSGIPWVIVCSCNPLRILEQDHYPPFSSGLAKDDRKGWTEFRSEFYPFAEQIQKRMNDYLVSRGCAELSTHVLINRSPYLNVYGYPLELDYLDMSPLPANYCRFDNLMRNEDPKFATKKFEISDKLKSRSGKLIFFSMGSMGGLDVQLMKRLIAILAKSEHRFVVSKGPAHDKYELPDNMWGKASLPQIQVLPAVDLVITHGGNNTFTESLFFGKPMIVTPLFGDQYDNAQRVHDKGLGLRLDPYHCTEDELIGGIDWLLSNKAVNERLKNISERIQRDKSIEQFPKIIENLILKSK